MIISFLRGGGGGSSRLQTKSFTAESNHSQTTVLPDTGYDGMSALNLYVDTGWDMANVNNNEITGLTSSDLLGFSEGIKDYFFYGCTLIESVDLPGSITKLYKGAFKGCTGLTTINLDNVQACGQEVFSGCTSLSGGITLGATGLTTSLFSGCYNITSITCNNVVSIADSSLTGCSGLTFIDMSSRNTELGVPTLASASVFDDLDPGYLISVPADLYDTWIATAPWNQVASHIIGPYYATTKYTTTEANQTKNILYQAGNYNFIIDGTAVTYTSEDGITYTFEEPGEHTVIYLYDSAQVDSRAEYSDIESFKASAAMGSMANYGLCYCYNLQSVDLNNITSIGSNVFRSSSALTSLDLSNVHSMGNNALRDSYLTEINFGSGLTNVGYNLCNHSQEATAVTFAEGTTGLTSFQTLGDNMTALQEIVFPDCIQSYCQSSMSYALIAGATSLSAVTFGSGATSFIGLVFGGSMPNLTTINCYASNEPTLSHLGEGVFSAVTGNTGTLHVPSGATYTNWASELGANWTVVDDL